MTKSKILKLDQGPYNAMYLNNGFAFAHCSTVNKGVITQLTGFGACREGFTHQIFADSKHRLSTSRLRCLVRTVTMTPGKDIKDQFGKQTKAGLEILNILEDHYNWPLTKMFDVNTTTLKTKRDQNPRRGFVRLLVGSSKWLKSPHTASLFLLLFRLPTRHTSFLEIKDYEQLMETCRKYAGLPKPGSKVAAKKVGGDKNYVAKTIRFWGPLMSNLNRIFKGTTIRGNFNKGNYRRYYGDEGISKLCNFACSNTKIQERFVALAKDAKVVTETGQTFRK